MLQSLFCCFRGVGDTEDGGILPHDPPPPYQAVTKTQEYAHVKPSQCLQEAVETQIKPLEEQSQIGVQGARQPATNSPYDKTAFQPDELGKTHKEFTASEAIKLVGSFRFDDGRLKSL